MNCELSSAIIKRDPIVTGYYTNIKKIMTTSLKRSTSKKYFLSDCIQKDVLDVANDYILICSLDKNILPIEYYNKSAAQFFDWGKKKIEGKNLLDVIDNFHLKEYLVEHFKDFSKSSEKKFKPRPFCQRDAHTIVWRLKKITHSSKSSISYLLLMGDDITESENLRTEKQNAQDILNSIKNSIPGNLYWKDINGKYIGCNDFLLEQHSLTNTNKSIIGKTDYDLFDKDVADKLRENDLDIIKTGLPHSFEESIQLPNQSPRFYLVSKMPLKDSYGKILGIVGNSIEITERKKMEQELLDAKERAEAANETKNMFMENMSHDFKTPLNAIWGIVQILLDLVIKYPQQFTDEVKMYIEGLAKSAERLKKMVESILNFNKIYAGKIKIEREELNLLDIIENIVGSLSYQLKNKDLNIIINYPPSVPKHLISDVHTVNSVILNLMSNAVKFTEKGYVTISVKKGRQEGKDIQLIIRVEDTGQGIPNDKFKEIFERFHRLELSNKGEKEGHGIGLSSVKGLVDLLNGKIDVQSEHGKGSAFTVTLPFEILDNDYWVTEWDKHHPNVHILLIQDKKTTSEVLLSVGDKMDKSESTAALHRLILAEQKQNPYQILIVDDEINTDPFTFIESIKTSKNISSLMIILVSQPNRDKKWFDQARKLGCFDFINKPVLPSEADDVIVKAWNKWQTAPKQI